MQGTSWGDASGQGVREAGRGGEVVSAAKETHPGPMGGSSAWESPGGWLDTDCWALPYSV